MRNVMMTLVAVFGLVLAVGAGGAGVGCQSSQPEVKSSYRSQWTTVNASTAKTTDAAKAVLEEDKLQDIKATSTKLDGAASGKKADGTKISIAIQKQGESSEVSVNVGTMGDPRVGADIARRIKDRAENNAPTTAPAPAPAPAPARP